MSKSGKIALGAAVLIAFATVAIAQAKKETPRKYGIGHVARRGSGAIGRLGYRRSTRTGRARRQAAGR